MAIKQSKNRAFELEKQSKTDYFTYSFTSTASSFDKKDVLGGKWFNLVFSVDLKVVNKAFSIYS